MEAAAAGCCLVGDGACVYLYIPVFMCLSRDLSRDVYTGLVRRVYLLTACECVLALMQGFKSTGGRSDTELLVDCGKDYQKDVDFGESGVRG